MYSFRKSKKGFTLIELMVVVVIIGVLALLGLRLYLTQIAKSNNALIKANAGTVQTTIQGDLADFKTADRLFVDEMPDLEEVTEQGTYKNVTFGENRYQIQLKTYGLKFAIGRNTIINDDVNALTRVPAMFGRSSGRSIAKKVIGQIEGDGNPQDDY